MADQEVEGVSEAVAEEGTPAEAGGATPSATPSATNNPTTKRKRSEPRDPNAPKRPSSAYIYFSTEMRPKVREDKPGMSMSDRSKYIGKTWATLEADKKKQYQDLAHTDKQRYIREYMAYQETDTYKQYMRSKHPGLKKSKAGEKEATPAKAPGKVPLSCQQQFIPGSNIPIFSERFLQHNRDLESQLRKLRQTSSNLEEENAMLSRHVENMKSAVLRVQQEVEKQEEKNENLQGHLSVLREVLATTFKDIPLPDTKETPTAGSIDSYMGKLQTIIANEPGKYPDLVQKVSFIAKQLEKVLKEKLSQDVLSGTVLEGEGEEPEGEGVADGVEPMVT